MADKFPTTKHELNIEMLLDILSTGRPWGGVNENALAEKYIDPLPGCVIDKEGNRIISVGDSYSHAFSCHLDTVHPKDTKHRLALIKDTHTVFNYDDGILGADDGAGVWTLLMLLKHGVPGLYLFHVGEEKGGVGSSHIAENNPGLLEPIDMILAFDRRGTKDIITSQMTGTCCSDEWANALSKQLDMGHKPAAGSFTDTANYTSLVAECSNISIGYENEHSKYETQDVEYLAKLVDKLIEVDWAALPVKRDPTAEIDYYDRFDSYYDRQWNTAYTNTRGTSKSTPKEKITFDTRTRVENLELIAELVQYEPEALANVLYTKYGFDYDDILWDVVQDENCQYDWGDASEVAKAN
jgi:hypothetical protein